MDSLAAAQLRIVRMASAVTLTADNFADVFLGDLELDDIGLVAGDLRDLDALDLIDERFRDVFN